MLDPAAESRVASQLSLGFLMEGKGPESKGVAQKMRPSPIRVKAVRIEDESPIQSPHRGDSVEKHEEILMASPKNDPLGSSPKKEGTRATALYTDNKCTLIPGPLPDLEGLSISDGAPEPTSPPAASSSSSSASSASLLSTSHLPTPSSASADGKVLQVQRQLDGASEAITASPSMAMLDGGPKNQVKDEDGLYLYPTNTIVASNGEVYHVEPFQLPPPNEIASLISELRETRRERGGSNVGINERDRGYSISSRDGGSGNGYNYGSFNTPFGSATMQRRRNNSGKRGEIPEPGDWINMKAIDTSAGRKKGTIDPTSSSSAGNTESSSAQSPPRPNQYKEDPDYFDLDAFSIKSYLSTELMGLGEPSNVEQKAVDSIENFLAVPFKLEGFLSFGWFICLDNFLYVLTFLPIRFIMCLPLLYQYFVDRIPHLRFLPRLVPIGNDLHRTHVYDLMRGSFVIIGFVCLKWLDMSRVYHYVRQQSTIKLYVLTGMLEIFDKLLCSFGQDAFDLLYWQTRNQPSWRNLVFSFSLVSIYIIIHSTMYFLLVATLTVAINSADQAMIAVMVLNNFAEIKSFVFKKFDKQNLFQLACADVTERFNLTLFMSTIFLVGVVQAGEELWHEVAYSFSTTIMWMVMCEAGADWIKHAFILSFFFLQRAQL